MSLPLNKIISSIIKEFEKASLSVDLSREYLRESYQSHPILKDSIPSRIRVSEASISLPLAFEKIEKEKTLIQELSKKQIYNLLLIDKETIPNKDEIAAKILNTLKRNKQARLDNKNLAGHITKAGRMIIKDFKLSDINFQNLEELQRSFATIPTKEQASRFIFQTDELEKIPSDRIFKMEFKIILE
jgi:hypothetical protein